MGIIVIALQARLRHDIYDLELIAQNLLQDCKGGKFRRRRVTELHGQGEEVLPRLAKAPLGNTRRRIGETPLTLANNIACSAPGSLDTSLSHAAGLIEIAACHA